MKKILVLGVGGMAGHVIAVSLRELGHEVTTITAKHKLDERTTLLDASDRKALTEYLSRHTFDVIVNAIGMLVQASEERKDLAVYLNSYLPHQLEQLLANSRTKLIHLSTDCVFSGNHAPYEETSFRDGDLFYDRSKALGEVINDKDLTFRMSIIGPDAQENGIGLFNWFYKQSGTIKGYTGSIWNGVTTIQLARAIDQAIQQKLVGLYHLVPSDTISKYDLLRLFCKVFERDDITVVPTEGTNLNKTLINTRSDFAFTLPSYDLMIEEMRHWIEAHYTLYPHYKRSKEQK